jgi:hypothetical protein
MVYHIITGHNYQSIENSFKISIFFTNKKLILNYWSIECVFVANIKNLYFYYCPPYVHPQETIPDKIISEQYVSLITLKTLAFTKYLFNCLLSADLCHRCKSYGRKKLRFLKKSNSADADENKSSQFSFVRHLRARALIRRNLKSSRAGKVRD